MQMKIIDIENLKSDIDDFRKAKASAFDSYIEAEETLITSKKIHEEMKILIENCKVEIDIILSEIQEIAKS